MIEISELVKILPQAYPFLLIDKVVSFEKGKSLVAIKNITANEWPVDHYNSTVNHASHTDQCFPETLLIESASQAALALHQISLVEEGEDVQYLLTRTKAEFLESVTIGDQVIFNVVATKMMKKLGIMDIELTLKTEKKIGSVQIYYKIADEEDV